MQLNISPQPRVAGESIAVQGGSQLAVKVEGVLVHGSRPGIFRKAADIVVTLVSQLQARQHNQTENKVGLATAEFKSIVSFLITFIFIMKPATDLLRATIILLN